MKKNKNKVFVVIAILLVGYFVVDYFFNDESITSTNIESLVYPDVSYNRAVEVDENNIVIYSEEIYISNSGTYIFSGDYENTTITIEIDTEVDEDYVYIIFDNTTISTTESRLIDVISAEKLVIQTTETSVNYLTQDYDSSLDTETSAVIYSKSDVIISGDGTLNIETNSNDAINGRDDVIIEDTNLYIEASGDGIVGRDYLAITNSNITVYSGADSLKSSNTESGKGDILIESGTYYIYSDGDGISASNTLQINDGNFEIESGGGYTGILKEIVVGEGGTDQSYLIETSGKSLKGYNIIINNGNFDLSSYEDAIHSDYDLYIAGGDITINAGDDGVHANNNLVIDDASLLIENAYEGLEGNSITINGGVIDAYVYDDAMNSSGEDGILTITGGEIYLYSVGDGIDSNGDFLMTGGTIIIENEAIYTMGDYSVDIAGSIEVTGGSIVDENGDDVDYENVMSSGSNQMTIPSSRR